MKYFLTLLTLFLITEFEISCQPAIAPPLITLKAGVFNSAIYGTDYRSYELKNTVFFQPGISGGVLFKNLVYVGISGSNLHWMYEEMDIEYTWLYDQDLIF